MSLLALLGRVERGGQSVGAQHAREWSTEFVVQALHAYGFLAILFCHLFYNPYLISSF